VGSTGYSWRADKMTDVRADVRAHDSLGLSPNHDI